MKKKFKFKIVTSDFVFKTTDMVLAHSFLKCLSEIQDEAKGLAMETFNNIISGKFFGTASTEQNNPEEQPKPTTTGVADIRGGTIGGWPTGRKLIKREVKDSEKPIRKLIRTQGYQKKSKWSKEEDEFMLNSLANKIREPKLKFGVIYDQYVRKFGNKKTYPTVFCRFQTLEKLNIKKSMITKNGLVNQMEASILDLLVKVKHMQKNKNKIQDDNSQESTT